MLVFVVVAIGFLVYIAVLLAVMVLTAILWALSSLALWITGLKPRPSQKNVASARRDPPRVQRPVPAQAPPRAATPVRDPALRPAQAPAPSDIWPKWTPAHRRYVDEELALWQEQFDALNSSK